ncbi:hypothetical protein M1C57_14580 [Rhodococcus pyridinivorans]|uniref:hypothetical protein n=1 Tax=Rhodococcus pyridinivorans TaxID=103816 RepID=UPI002009E86E|nr:hypothetical protein [Rhodococcus pyridinivorans]UPW02923.1 hypothetical protein M1C57_14580 [Rhodococcus pyridinivorans]
MRAVAPIQQCCGGTCGSVDVDGALTLDGFLMLPVAHTPHRPLSSSSSLAWSGASAVRWIVALFHGRRLLSDVPGCGSCANRVGLIEENGSGKSTLLKRLPV